MANNAKQIGKNEEPLQQAEGGGDIIRQIQDSLQDHSAQTECTLFCFTVSVFSLLVDRIKFKPPTLLYSGGAKLKTIKTASLFWEHYLHLKSYFCF